MNTIWQNISSASCPSPGVKVDCCLQVKGIESVYALGDCAACLQTDGSLVPPRAQAAHQQADYLYKKLLALDKGLLPSNAPYKYKDYGSLVSLGSRSSVGSLMGSLFKSSSSLVKMH